MILKKVLAFLFVAVFTMSLTTLTFASEIETQIKATDIEIGRYDTQMNMGGTQYLTVTVVPSDSTENKVSYTSSDESVATVSESGEVKGISKGNVIIGISAGDIKKEISITVKIATKAINLNSEYLVLKPSDTFNITAKVLPSEANQIISFKSINTAIASVNEQGQIKAISVGTTSVIVSNGDMSSVITVIVNQNGTSSRTENVESEKVFKPSILTEKEIMLLDIIKSGQNEIQLDANEYRILSKNILEEIFNSGKSLKIKAEKYSLIVDGKNIVNYNNELLTNIEFKYGKEGTTFVLNEDKNLPGLVVLELSDELVGKYLYLYNDEKEIYQKLEMKNQKILELDESGKYLLTDKEIGTLKIEPVFFVIGGLSIFAMAVIYVVVKRRYWFW